MDEAKRYLEEELVKLDLQIKDAELLVGQLGDVAMTEIIELKKQKIAIEAAITNSGPTSPAATLGAGQIFNSVILEVRPGVGGEEAKIWAADLMRMYTRYAEIKKWKTEWLDEDVVKISGKGVFEALKSETGVHRVQRVPATEAQGRIHTSTCSVVVLPEVPESVVEIKEDELLWEFTRSGGHGGQNVNKVATAVRLTHRPTGLIVQARQERFQEQNRKIALSMLRAQLWEIEQEKKASVLAGQRAKIGRSMRAEKIRTYNYPQNRVTDHRLNQSWHQLEQIMEGRLDDVVNSMMVC